MVMVVVSSLVEIRDSVALIELKCLQLLELDLSNTALIQFWKHLEDNPRTPLKSIMASSFKPGGWWMSGFFVLDMNP